MCDAMQINIHETDAGEWLIALLGDLDGQVALGHEKMILDCSGLLYASSAGIGTLVMLHRRVRAAGGRVLIAGAVGPVFEILGMMNLGSILELVMDTAEAKRIYATTPGGPNG
jgi:anti-sigma B factor antagonist